MKKKIIIAILTLLYAFGAYYFTLPALNLKSPDFYVFLISIVIVYFLLSLAGTFNIGDIKHRTIDFKGLKLNTKISLVIVAVSIVILAAGQLISKELFHASAYQKMMPVTEREFAEDINQVSLNEVPIVDRDSAVQLGNRKLGELVDLVSQFEIDESSYSYTQINYQGTPTRVAPLVYGDVIKWLNNHKKGIPGYISVDMTNQDVTLVQLDQGIKYSPSEYFFRDLDRHLRFSYPTKMFDSYSFEVDEDGHPYWICPVINYKIGLFGGKDVVGVVIVDACDGTSEYYPIADAPTWIDRAYPASLIIKQIDDWGSYKNGYINTLFGQKDVCTSSDGYNYLALDDDVWLYTGLTSAGSDQSNIGFVLVNMRTKECRHYVVSGATEYSAMASAEGQVQHLSYKATFPVLLNIGNQPTYLMALKDNAGLVKKYAYVNVERYQLVGIGDSLSGGYTEYLKLVAANTSMDASTLESITGTISQISSAVKEGNTYFYIILDNKETVYMASVQMDDLLAVLKEGDRVAISYFDTETDFIEMNGIEKK